jgi:pimeloyl-ACP methyl ester carboxylesterase
VVQRRVDVDGDARDRGIVGARVATTSAQRQEAIRLDQYGPSRPSPWLDVDWREHQHWVTVAGRQMNVIDVGSGEQTIVFIHGLAGCWQNWLENIPAFTETHRVIAMDLPGFGGSEMPSERISIAGYGRIVAELLETLEAKATCVVGNSMGGFIGAELAIQRPDLLERLVLVSAAGITSQNQRSETLLGLLGRGENVLSFYAGWFATRSEVLSRRPRMRRAMMLFVAAHPDRLPAPLIAEQVRGSGKPGFLSALDALSDYPIRDRLEEIECPTLIVWGTDDRLVPLRDAYEFERLIGDNASVIVYDDTGHVAMLERPDAFNEALERFAADD